MARRELLAVERLVGALDDQVEGLGLDFLCAGEAAEEQRGEESDRLHSISRGVVQVSLGGQWWTGSGINAV